MPYSGIPQGALDTRYVNVTGDTMTGALIVNANSATALLVEQNGVNDDVLLVDTSTPLITATARLYLAQNADTVLMMQIFT